ncbi:MAG: MerR family transcriptional regulator [Faecalimonas sp.]|nr:MerR family transcriptional regulator [Faecalimonas sp.]
MKINEVEELLQIPRANIRYYEKEGFLSPRRTANGYREYTEEDLSILKKIIVLRKLGFSLALVKDILYGTLPLSDALEQNMQELYTQITNLNGALEICRILQKDTTAFDENYYWELIQNKEKAGGRFADFAKDCFEHEKRLLTDIFGFTSIWTFLLTCIILGFAGKYMSEESGFFYGIFYWISQIGLVVIISFPIVILDRKYARNHKSKISHPTPWWKKILILLGGIFTFLILFVFGISIIESYLLEFIMGDATAYVVTSNMVLPPLIGSLFFTVMLIWLYFGKQCPLPKRAKRKATLLSFCVFLLCAGSLLTWCDTITPQTATVRRLFLCRSYTWEEVDYYTLNHSTDGLLRYTIVMKDGTRTELLDGGISISTLSEEEYPNDIESFGLELSQTFKEIGIPLKADWAILNKKLSPYWKDYAKQVRQIAE